MTRPPGHRAEPPFSDFQLRIEHAGTATGAGPVLVPVVDGRNLFADLLGLKGVGRDPDSLLGRESPLLPVDWPAPPRTALLWRCSCGIEGCGFASARITEERFNNDYDHVVWSDFTLHCLGEAEPPAELRFRARQYRAELVRCHADRSWETPARRVAREVTAALDADPGVLGRWGCGLLWAKECSSRGSIAVLVTDGNAEQQCRFDADLGSEAIVRQLRERDPREGSAHRYPRP